MYRNYMAWFTPTLTAFLAAVSLTILVYLVAINPSYAEPSDPQPSGWKSAEGDGNIARADLVGGTGLDHRKQAVDG